MTKRTGAEQSPMIIPSVIPPVDQFAARSAISIKTSTFVYLKDQSRMCLGLALMSGTVPDEGVYQVFTAIRNKGESASNKELALIGQAYALRITNGQTNWRS